MSLPESIASEIQKLSPSALIELFELDLTDLGGDISRFHAGTNELSQDVIWQGDTYVKYPIQAEGFDFSSNGQIPRPKMRVSNVFGSITSLLLFYDDMLGAKVTRKRTLAKYLDAVNFTGGVNPDADDTAEFSSDIFYIDRKVSENPDAVEFELAAAIDLQGIQIPRRQVIQNVCSWKYRGAECGYVGTNYFDTSDNVVSTLGEDRCGKRLTSCRIRFGQFAEIPYGGYPSAGLVR